jgi:hypothetical protein
VESDVKRMESEGGIVEPDVPEKRGPSENQILKKMMIALSTAGARIFRNHVGMAYQGKAIRFSAPARIAVEPGDIVIRQARTVRAGLMTGSSDLIGWYPRMITEYDLGRVMAVFTAVEAKSEHGTLEPEQRQFLEVVRDSGGIAIVARDNESAISKLNNGGGLE